MFSSKNLNFTHKFVFDTDHKRLDVTIT